MIVLFSLPEYTREKYLFFRSPANRVNGKHKSDCKPATGQNADAVPHVERWFTREIALPKGT